MTMPNDPGAPENTDEQNLSPDQAEQAAAQAAEGQGVDEEEALDAEAIADAKADVAEEAAEADEQVVEDLVEDPEADLQTQLDERTEDLQRITAEYANYRRRTLAERDGIVAGAKAAVVSQMLPILDDLDLARQHGDLEEGPFKAFADKFAGVLEGQKLASFGEVGEAFDPEIHEAVQDLSEGEEKTIGTVLRKGYRLADRVIRTAMVIISDPESENSEVAAD